MSKFFQMDGQTRKSLNDWDWNGRLNANCDFQATSANWQVIVCWVELVRFRFRTALPFNVAFSSTLSRKSTSFSADILRMFGTFEPQRIQISGRRAGSLPRAGLGNVVSTEDESPRTNLSDSDNRIDFPFGNQKVTPYKKNSGVYVTFIKIAYFFSWSLWMMAG